ncbi:hypothetical protein B0H13DRAFT_2357165 [Mycena leptocephala]|nr:hypothetical protein B0H13DRAFT_2357165 [Mycena leptocephala]
MPPAVRKDRFHAFGIHKAPPGLSTKDFEAKLEALVDHLLALPLVQRSVLKLEMLFQNELCDEHVKEFGFLSPTIVVISMESESADHLLAVFCDSEVQKVFDSGKELGLQSGICTFSADVVAKIDSASPDAQNGPGVHTVAILRVPHVLSPEQYAQQIHPLIDKLTALPAAQKTFRKYDLWVQNTVMDDHMRALGHPAPELTFIRRGESANLASVIELTRDAETRKLFLGAKQDFAYSANSFLFTADVVTKIDKF